MSYLFLPVCWGRGFKDGWAADLHLFIIDSILPKSFSWGFFVLVLLVTRFLLSVLTLLHASMFSSLLSFLHFLSITYIMLHGLMF